MPAYIGFPNLRNTLALRLWKMSGAAHLATTGHFRLPQKIMLAHPM
jgi:hypothetical protein